MVLMACILMSKYRIKISFVETYLPPFETCIRDAKVASIMTSLNAINGVPACAHTFLLQTIAR